MLKNILKVEGIEKLDRGKLKSINGSWWSGCTENQCWWDGPRWTCCPGVPDQ